jgi:hypothetical protein
MVNYSMIPQRYFRASEQVYEAARGQLDAKWGHAPGTGTDTCYEPAATAPHDTEGRVLLAVRAEFCEYPAVASLLPSLLAGGMVEEISESEYRASLPQPPV